MKIHVFAIAIIFMMLPSKITSQNNCLTIINDSTISITTVDTIQKDSSGIYNLYRSPIDSLNFYKIVRDKKISKPQKIYVSSNDTSFTWGIASLSFPDKISSRFFTIGKDSVSIVWGIDSLTLCIAPNFISNVNPNDSIAVTGSEVNPDEENKLGILLWILSGSVLFLLVLLICRKKCGKGLDRSYYKKIKDELYYNLACRNLIECKYEDAKKCVEKLSSDSLKETFNKELKNKGKDESDGKNISIPCLNLFENPRSDEYESLKKFKEGIIEYVFSGQEKNYANEDVQLDDVLEMLNSRSNTQDSVFGSYVSAEETKQPSFEGNKTDSEEINITENKYSLEYDFKNALNKPNEDQKTILNGYLKNVCDKPNEDQKTILNGYLKNVCAKPNEDQKTILNGYFKNVCDKPNEDQKTILNGYLKNALNEPNEDQKTILNGYFKNVCDKPNEDQKTILNGYLKNVCDKPNENQRAILMLYVKNTLEDWFSVDLVSCKSSDDIKNGYVLKLSKDLEGCCIKQLNAKLNGERIYRSNDCLNSNNEKQTNVIEFDTEESSKNGDSGNLSGNVDINTVQSDVIKNIAKVISEIFKENSEFKSKLDQICNSKTIDEFNSDLTSLLGSIVAVLNGLEKYGSDAEKIKSGIQQETVNDIACFIYESFKDNHEINDKVQKIYESKDLNELKSNLKELLNSLIEKLQNEKKRIDNLTSEVDKSYNDLFKKDIEAAKPHIEQFITEAKNVINTIRKDNEEINNKCESYKAVFYECINSTFDRIVASISEVGTDTSDTEETKKIVKIFREKVQCNSDSSLNNLNNLKNKLKEICDNAGDYGKFKAEVIELFKNLLGKNCWIHALTKMYLYVQHMKIAQKFEDTGLSVSEIDRAFILTEHLLRLIGIELEYPQLFKDSFDVNRYESRSLNDIVEIVGNNIFKELLCNRHDTIIDLHRVGFKVEGKEEKKPVVSNYS